MVEFDRGYFQSSNWHATEKRNRPNRNPELVPRTIQRNPPPPDTVPNRGQSPETTSVKARPAETLEVRKSSPRMKR